MEKIGSKFLKIKLFIWYFIVTYSFFLLRMRGEGITLLREKGYFWILNSYVCIFAFNVGHLLGSFAASLAEENRRWSPYRGNGCPVTEIVSRTATVCHVLQKQTGLQSPPTPLRLRTTSALRWTGISPNTPGSQTQITTSRIAKK